jgi:hypothetical protein
MAGRGFVNRGKDVIDDIFNELDIIKEVFIKQANIKTPTAPLYKFPGVDPGDLPDDPVEGQFAISQDDKFWIYRNSAWHKVGGDAELKWVVARGGYGNPPFATGNTQPDSILPYLSIVSSSDGIDASSLVIGEGYKSSENGVYTIDLDPGGGDFAGGLKIPTGMWVSFSSLQLTTFDVVPASTIVGFASASTDYGSALQVGGLDRSAAIWSEAGYRGWKLSDVLIRYHTTASSGILLEYTGSTAIFTHISAWYLTSLYVQLSPDFFQFII